MTTEAPPKQNGNGQPRFNPDEPGVRNNFDVQFWEMTRNVFSNRMDYFQKLLDPRRDLDRECGYPSTYSVGPDLYRQLYDRDPIANRVVQLMPKECWQKTPRVYEDESSKHVTDFEEAWDNLSSQLAPERSWYQDEEGSLVWEYLRRADEISGIGAFGIILLGLDDGADLRDPVEGAISDKYVRSRDGKAKTTNNGKPRLDPAKLSFPTPMPDESVLDEMVKNSATPPMERWSEGGSVALKHVDQALAHARKFDPRFVRNAEGERWELFREGQIVTNEIKTGQQVVSTGGQDQQYFSQGAGGLGRSASGQDAQYVGVQLGPTQFPVEKPIKKDIGLTFLRVFDEALVQIVQYEANIRNPRFGRPVTYRVTFNDPREQHSGIGLPIASIYVHWTRIVHLADTGNGVASEIFAAPRMRPVLNPLLDGRKISGAGAEGYWQSCFAGVVLSTHPQLGGEVTIDKASTKDQIENYMNSLQRYLVLSGMGATTLAPTIVDPTPHVDGQIQRICIQLGCPKRVFMGSERGELASSQDDSSWNDRVAHRQNTYVTPRVICPFIDRLILLGVLPEPEGYSIEWPDLDSTTKKDKATIAGTLTTALQAYVAGNVEAVMTFRDYLVHVWDWDEETVDAVVEGVKKQQEKDMMTMPPKGEPGHPATVAPPPKPPTPGPTILGPGQTAIPHPDAGGGKPFTAPGKPAPGVQVAAAPATDQPVAPAIQGRSNPTKNEATENSNPEGHNQYSGGSLVPEHAAIGKLVKFKLMVGSVPPKEVTVAGTVKRHTGEGNVEVKTQQHGYHTLHHSKLITTNQFCATGPDGGVDPTCSPHEGGGKIEGVKGVGSQADPYRCKDDIKLAAKLLSEGHHIRLKQPDQVATLLDKMHKMVWEAVEKGEKAPKFDLCNVSAAGTNLFCQDSKGIPRVDMPQMKGIAEPGSKAHAMGVDKKGEADLSKAFIDHMKSQGIKTEKTDVRASHLRASQGEIVGSKIAKMVTEAKAGMRDLRDKPIFVTKDNYVVDGHHHWAALVGLGSAKGKDFKVPVYKLDCDIGKALSMANAYTKSMGLRSKSGKTENVSPRALDWIDVINSNPEGCNQYKACGEGSSEEHTTGASIGHPGHQIEAVGSMLHIHSLYDIGGGMLSVGGVLAGLKLMGGRVGATTTQIEHAAMSWVKDKVSQGVDKATSKLSEPPKEAVKSLLNGVQAAARFGTKVAFASYTAGQSLAERISQEKGSTPEQAASLRSTLSHADLTLAKPLAYAGHATGIGGAAISFVPLASASYIAASSVTHPLATARAAWKSIGDVMKSSSHADPLGLRGAIAGTHGIRRLATNATTVELAALAGAIVARDYDEWYVTLLNAALDHSKTVAEALTLADAAYKKTPADPSSPQKDDGQWLLDQFKLTENSFCPTGSGGGIDPSCGAGESKSIKNLKQKSYKEGFISGQAGKTSLDNPHKLTRGASLEKTLGEWWTRGNNDARIGKEEKKFPKDKPPTKNSNSNHDEKGRFAVGDIDGVRQLVHRYAHFVENSHVFNEDDQDDDEMVSDAITSHDGSEWYEELLQAAMEETGGNVALAVKFADEYFAENPDEGDDEDDEDLDEDVTENAFCPTGSGGGQDNSCSSHSGDGKLPGEEHYDEAFKHADEKTMTQEHLDSFGEKLSKMSPKELKQLAVKVSGNDYMTGSKKQSIEKLRSRLLSHMESRLNTSFG